VCTKTLEHCPHPRARTRDPRFLTRCLILQVTCQGCYDRDEYYKRWGSLNCTNRLYEQNRWVRTERAEGKPRRCNKEEHDRAVGYLNGLLGGADAAKGMHRERKERESANLQERLMGAAKVCHRLNTLSWEESASKAPPRNLPILPPAATHAHSFHHPR
jgi:hypothetical protein